MGNAAKKMKAVIVSPYIKTLGGGERYALTVAQALLDRGWEVEITLNENDVLLKARERFNLKLAGIGTISFGEIGGKYLKQKNYDLMFWVSDGSIPWLFSPKTVLHFQIPFHNVRGKSFFNSLKFKKIDKVVCNSLFTKKVIDQEYGINSDVWYPPIDVEEFTAGEKENTILAVGRFEKSQTEKRQDVLIETFKKMIDKGLKNWQLILAGGHTGGKENDELLNELKKMAAGFPISFKINVSFSELKTLYSKAKIFWHAAGYGTDEEKYPEKMEHFGMTTVEAMASGCVPVVINKGGQKEIVQNNINGFLWETVDDLMNLSAKLIKGDKLINNISQEAVKKSRDFSKEKFYEKIYSFIS